MTVAEVSCPTADVLEELRQLIHLSIDARARFREFLDTKPVIAALKVDWADTARAGHTIRYDEPSQELLDTLATLRILAENEQRRSLDHRQRHTKSLLVLGGTS
jgi:hypothetical protein